MTEEINFNCICDLTTKTLGLEKGSLGLRSRRRPLQVARAAASYIARQEEDIHRTVIANALNRDRTVVYHYERNHEAKYRSCKLYRDAFNKVYKAYKCVDDDKEVFINNSHMKRYLLRNGVSESDNSDVIIEINSGTAKCFINTTYFKFSKELENINLAMKNYHYTVKII